MSKAVTDNSLRWYALSTKSRHEKKVQERLTAKGFETYVPLRTVIKKWSDRKKRVEEPLFTGYVFVYMLFSRRINALETFGVVRMVMFNGRPGYLHQQEIDTIRHILSAQRESGYTVEAFDGKMVGDFVEVVEGPLTGLRGQFIKVKNESKLTISIDGIGKSLIVDVPPEWVKKISEFNEPRRH
jgi:transcription antitermination factor NusG